MIKKIMKKILVIFIIMATIACEYVVKENPETEKQSENILLSNSEHMVMATLWFQQSAEAQALYYQCFNTAKLLLDIQLDTIENIKNKAVVVDIDETMLNNSPYQVNLIKTGKSYALESWQAWTARAEAKALPGAVDFAKYAQKKGIEVFYISNRRVEELDATLINLQKAGFPYADKAHLFLRKEKSTKTPRRNIVRDKGFDILLFIGDNLTDFSDIYENRDEKLAFDLVKKNKDLFGKRFIILPNPMYGEWEKAIYKNSCKLSAQQKDSLRKNILFQKNDFVH